MHEPNVQRVLETIRKDDVVLDVGGWASPFNRANFVLDAEPYETRGFYRTFGGPPSQGGETEYFTANTWIRRDICGREPFPFRDKEIDFAICSHTLEDVRDPLWVCAEMIRVAKRGYIEVPSRRAESSRGWERPRQVGLSHHRWLIDIEGTNIRFLMKYHMIHSHWRYSLPAAYFRSLREDERIQWLFWDGGFQFSETTIHGLDNISAELEGYVRRMSPYPSWRVAADARVRRLRLLAAKAQGRVRRLTGADHPSPLK